MRRTEEFDWVMGGHRPSFRSDGSEAAGNAVVSYLLDRSKPMTLQIQHELVEQDQPLHQTAAGLFLTEDMFQIRNLYGKEIALVQEELKEATKDGDKKAQQELDNALQDLLSRIKKVNEDLARMKTGHRQMIENFAVKRRRECVTGFAVTSSLLEHAYDGGVSTSHRPSFWLCYVVVRHAHCRNRVVESDGSPAAPGPRVQQAHKSRR
jgi:hypothetical protein